MTCGVKRKSDGNNNKYINQSINQEEEEREDECKGGVFSLICVLLMVTLYRKTNNSIRYHYNYDYLVLVLWLDNIDS